MKPLYELLSALFPILALGISAFLVNLLLHELGHAIPKLCWSRQRVLVYIGSMGDPEQSWRLSLGRLEIFLKYNPFLWKRGLCRSDERLPVGKRMFVVAMGPLVSLLLTIIPFVLLKTIEPTERQTVILVTFMVVGGIFTWSSAIPRGRLNPTDLGGGVRNDAMQLIELWKTRHLPATYWEVCDKFQAKEYAEASDLAEQMIEEDNSQVAVYRLAISVHLTSGRYERAEALLELIRSRYRFSLEDEINDGCHKILTGRYRHAIAIYTELARLHYNHFLILNNLGYALVAAGESEKAMLYLDRGITLAPRFSELYATRAWGKMTLGQWEEGREDAQQALKLKESCVDAHRALGLYAKEKGEWANAKEYFLKARSIDPRSPFLDEPLADVERRLEVERNAAV